MAESEETYLRECLERGICPTCQETIVEKHGSGNFKQGVFCSLSCDAKWREAALIRAHLERVKKESSDE